MCCGQSQGSLTSANGSHRQSASATTGLVFAIYNLGKRLLFSNQQPILPPLLTLPSLFLTLDAGTVGAIPFVGPANDYLGRRAGMFIGALTVILGSLISALAKDHGMFMAGRFVLGFGVAFCNISSPVYVGEMAHPQWRGVQMGLYNCF